MGKNAYQSDFRQHAVKDFQSQPLRVAQSELNPSLAPYPPMPYRNFINLNDEQLDKPVYRIMSLTRLEQVLLDKQLTLVKPRKWDDPFENALLASAFATKNGENVGFAAKDSVYGQCWTLHRETDAMWRIYSHDKDGIRVTSTPRKLLAALNKSDPKFSPVRAFIGKVSYLKKKDLLVRFGQINLLDPNGSGIAESLLYKRNEFRHEAEVRLIYSGPDNQCPDDLYQVPIEPSALFDKMFFDPRMDTNQYRTGRAILRKLGYKGTIEKSALYAAPTGLVFTL